MAATTTADYWVGALIGEGSYSRVVHCKYKSSNQDVALKILDKVALQKHPSVMAGLWAERTLLHSLQSDYVVNLWASFHDSQSVYLVLDCLFGGDLSQLIQYGLGDGRTTRSAEHYQNWIESIPHYGLQIIKGLEYIHRQQVIHCDLKSANVLCTTKGRIKLADFAFAVDMKTTKAENSTTTNDKKATFTTLRGTADYASPELQRGIEEITPAVDLWSLGCIFCECFFGETPFHASNDLLATQRVMDYVNQKTTLAQLFPSEGDQTSMDMFHREWKSLIGNLLSSSPKDRPSLQQLQSNACFASIDIANDPKFLPREPEWVVQTRNAKMKDGKAGWAVFEL
jgi:3-phosphoinositide dependent protein kinase-1